MTTPHGKEAACAPRRGLSLRFIALSPSPTYATATPPTIVKDCKGFTSTDYAAGPFFWQSSWVEPQNGRRTPIVSCLHRDAFRLLIKRRTKYARRSSTDGVVQAPAPARLIPGGMPTEAPVAQMLVSKYADHLPLYRQAQICSRQGVDLDRSTLADWVGGAAFELRPVYNALMADLKRSTKPFMDETRAPVLNPGARKTKTGYFWALARDDRPWGGTAPPGVAFCYAPPPGRRGGQHAERILQGFGGALQVDGYAGYNRLIAPDHVGPGIQLAHCCAHARRKLIEITRTGAELIAEEGVALIRDLYAVEAEIRGCDPATRLAVRQERTAPILRESATGRITIGCALPDGAPSSPP